MMPNLVFTSSVLLYFMVLYFVPFWVAKGLEDLIGSDGARFEFKASAARLYPGANNVLLEYRSAQPGYRVPVMREYSR